MLISHNQFPSSVIHGAQLQTRRGDKEAVDLEVLVDWRRGDNIRFKEERGEINMEWYMMKKS